MGWISTHNSKSLDEFLLVMTSKVDVIFRAKCFSIAQNMAKATTFFSLPFLHKQIPIPIH